MCVGGGRGAAGRLRKSRAFGRESTGVERELERGSAHAVLNFYVPAEEKLKSSFCPQANKSGSPLRCQIKLAPCSATAQLSTCAYSVMKSGVWLCVCVCVCITVYVCVCSHVSNHRF